MANELRTLDAKNRALRTFVQGLGIDVAVGLALVLGTYFMTAQSWGDVQWAILGFSLFKSVVQAVSAYVMRQWMDRKTDVLLPPASAGPPVDPDVNPHTEGGYAVLRLVIQIALLVLVVFFIVWLVTAL